MDTNAKIFVNYRRKQEGGWAAEAIATRLKAEFGADRVFLDTQNIRPSTRFTQEIRTEIARAAALIVVLGKDWHKIQDEESGEKRLNEKDDWVREEIRTALERTIPIAIILLDDAKLPEAEWLPEDIRAFVENQTANIRQSQAEHDLEPVLEELAKLTGFVRKEGRSSDSSQAARVRSGAGVPGRAQRAVPLVASRSPIVVAIETADAPLKEQELLAAERHLTVSLPDREFKALQSIGVRLRQANSVDAIVNLGIEAWENLKGASPCLENLFRLVNAAEQAQGAPQPIAWTGRGELLVGLRSAILLACRGDGALRGFLSVESGAHYFHPVSGETSRSMQRRLSGIRLEKISAGATEITPQTIAGALAKEVVLISADTVDPIIRRTVDLIRRQPTSPTRVILSFGQSTVEASLIEGVLAAIPCISFADLAIGDSPLVAETLRALPRSLKVQSVPVVLSRLRALLVEQALNQGDAPDVASLRGALEWSIWSWVGRPLFSDEFGEVRKPAYPHLMDLRDVASSDWYFERAEGIPADYQAEALTARESARRFHLYLSGAGGTGKSCFLRFIFEKLEVNEPAVLPVWYKVHAPSSDWDEVDTQIKREVRAALKRRFDGGDVGLLSEADDRKDLWKFLLDLLEKLRARKTGISEIVLFIDQLERTFESGDNPELRRLNTISAKIVALLKGVGIDRGVRVFIASRKQYLADFLSSFQKAEEIHLHFNVLQTLSVNFEGAGFIKRIVGWCNKNELTRAELNIDEAAARRLAGSEDGHPLNMMLALIQMLSRADLPEEIGEETVGKLRPWEQRFHVDEALAGKDDLVWYFFLAMAHARTEIVRREEVLWRLGLVSADLARQTRELGPNGVLERLWLLGHLGRTVHPRPQGNDSARFLEFFHANLRDHFVTNVMNRAEDRAGGDRLEAGRRLRRGMPASWRALDRLREIARDWDQLQQPLLREDITVLMDRKEVFTEPVAVQQKGEETEVESFYLLFMRDVGERRDSLFQAARECVAYSALVHDVHGRWAFKALFPNVAVAPGSRGVESSQVDCCRRWLQARRADQQSRLRILHYLVELRDTHANRLLAELIFDPSADEEIWQQLASILAEPLVASTHRSAFLTYAIQYLLDERIQFPGDNWASDRLGTFLVATCGSNGGEVNHLLETLVEEVATLGDPRLERALRELGDADRVGRWLRAPASSLDPALHAREVHGVIPPDLELRVGLELTRHIDSTSLKSWSREIEARLGIPLPAPSLCRAEISQHQRPGEEGNRSTRAGYELELLIHGRLIALGHFFPERIQTRTRDWDGAEQGTAIACYNEALGEPVRWVKSSAFDGIEWRRERRNFEQAAVDWLEILLRRYVAFVFSYDHVIPYLSRIVDVAGPGRVPPQGIRAISNVLYPVWKVLARLVRERVPLGKRGVDLLARLIELVREDSTFDEASILARLRESVCDDLCRSFVDEGNQLVILLFDEADERWLLNKLTITPERRSLGELTPEEELRLATAVRERFEAVARADHCAPVIVCEDHLRGPLFEILQHFDSRIFVLSYTELSPDVRLTSRGVIRRIGPAEAAPSTEAAP